MTLRAAPLDQTVRDALGDLLDEEVIAAAPEQAPARLREPEDPRSGGRRSPRSWLRSAPGSSIWSRRSSAETPPTHSWTPSGRSRPWRPAGPSGSRPAAAESARWGEPVLAPQAPVVSG